MSSEPDDEIGARTQTENAEVDGAVVRVDENVDNQGNEREQKGTEGDEEVDKEKHARKPMAPRSEMWEHFIKIKDDQGVVKKGKYKCWNLLSSARRPTRVNSGDNRVTCTGAIALLI